MVQAVIFDCFGVLIGKGFDKTYRAAGGDPDKDRSEIENALHKANLGEISDEEFHELMAQKIGISGAEWYDSNTKAEVRNDELLQFIVSLRKKVKTAILSNANIGVLDKKIGKAQLSAAFDEVVISAEVGMVKPQAAIYKLVCAKLNVLPGNCMYIDDRQIFLDAATSMGMKTHLYVAAEDCIRSIKSELEITS